MRAIPQATQHTRGERVIETAFFARARLEGNDLGYDTIAAAGNNATVLHWIRNTGSVHDGELLLVDAGVEADSLYTADITRTHGNGDATFQALVDGVEKLELGLCELVRPGTDYRDIHLVAHRGVAGLLKDLGVMRMDVEAMLAGGVTSIFFPHGIGHLLGLQVHDVAGFSAAPDGGSIDKPDGHPFLRLTRVLDGDFVVTIEPGVYFIPMLLEQLRAGPHAAAVDWSLVEHLSRFGGVRIEDNVRAVADAAPENLTRAAFAEPAVH